MSRAPAAVEHETLSVEGVADIDVRVIDSVRLEVGEVRTRQGWRHRVEQEGRDEIEFVFVHADGREVEYEVELRDGRLTGEVG